MIEKLRCWLNQLWHSVKTLFRIQQASQPILTWRFWFGVIVTAAVVLFIELGRRAGVVVPIPFLLLFGSVVLAANMAGLPAGLISAAIASAFITYAASISFGPPTLTGGPLQVILGALIHFVTAFFLGRTKSLNGFLIEQLRIYGESLEELVEAQTRELKEANQSLQLEVAERKQAQEELYYQATLLQNVSDAIMSTDMERNILSWNKAAEAIYGWRADEVIGKSVNEVIPTTYLDDEEESVVPQLLAEGIWKGEVIHKCKDGDEIIIQVSISLIEDSTEKPIGVVAVNRDITERKQIEEALRESEARYRAIVEIQTEFVSRKTPDGRLTFVNDAYCRHFGKTREELLGTNIMGFLVEEDRQALREKDLSLTPGNPIITSEHREYRPDGSIAWYHWTGQGIFDEKGQLIELQAVGRDITRRKQAEEALRESEAQYRAIVEVQTELVVRATPDGILTFVNDAYCRQFGKTREELLGTNYLTFVVEEDRQGVHKRDLSVTPENPVVINEHREYRPDGSIGWFQWTDRGIFDEAGQLIEFQSVGRDITRRKQAEEALRKSETRYRAIVEDQTEFISRSTPEGILTFVNEAYCRQFGQSREQLLGTNFINFLVEEDRQAVQETVLSLISDNPIITSEHREYRPDGSIAWYHWMSRGIFDEEGQLIEVQSVGRDITKRKQAEEALRESEARFQRLAEAAFEGIAITDQGTVIDVNDQVGEMLGYEPSELIGKSAIGFVAPESRDLVQKNIMSGYEDPYEHMALRKDGSTFPVEVRAKALPYRGRMLRVTAMRDITERKEAEEALRRSEERFSRAFHLNPSAIAISTLEDGRYLDVNQIFLNIHGYRREEVVGHTSAELNIWVETADRVRIVETLRRNGQVRNQEILFRTKSGEIRFALSSLEIIELDKKPYILSMFLDITERKQLEEQLRQTQKMEALGQLTAGIAHDFNNLLLVINGFAELLHLELTPNDPHQELLAKILHSGKRANNLVNQLLAFSRKQAIEPRLLDLNSTVIEMDKMMRRIIGENIELETKLEPDLWLVKIDPSQIEQIIINLAINARDAMPNGGRLTIETSKVVLDDDYVAHHLDSRPGEHVLLTVSDTGHGMSEEIKSRIFEPFFTTKEQDKGTGLGLATIYGIIRQNGGNIWVNSEEGIGTTFKIYLLRETEPTSLRIPYSEAEIETVVGTETILLVEDDPAVRHLISEVLVAQGYTLLEAQDGSEALQLAAQYENAIHLLLTDVIMPGMNGPILAEELSQVRLGLKVLFMSGYADSTIKGQSILDPNTNLLQKPFSPVALTRKIREVLDG